MAPSVKILPFQHRPEPTSRTIPISTGAAPSRSRIAAPGASKGCCRRCRHAPDRACCDASNPR
jgi:hypothetical protein